MLWKLILKALMSKKESYLRTIKTKKGVYILRIEKYKSLSDELEKWKNALYDKKSG